MFKIFRYKSVESITRNIIDIYKQFDAAFDTLGECIVYIEENPHEGDFEITVVDEFGDVVYSKYTQKTDVETQIKNLIAKLKKFDYEDKTY